MFNKVVQIISNRSGYKKEEIDISCRLADLGISSINIIEILMTIEYFSGIVVEYSSDFLTVGDLVKAIEEKGKSDNQR